jgi:drug/metabolite transporter (DMT)-like permease
VNQAPPASRVRVGASFAAIYLLWGSTYLAIRFGIATLPPFLMAGCRHLVAGMILLAWVFVRTGERPSRRDLARAALAGGLMLLGGNGLVTWSEQRVASGLAALLIATIPLWIVVLEAARPSGARPGVRAVAGALCGFAGVAVLLAGGQIAGAGVDLLGAGALLFAALSWSVGTLYLRRATISASPPLAVALEMLSGGTLLLLLGFATGEGRAFHPAAVSLRSIAALGYLIVFGSLIGFSAYTWLIRVSTPSRVATYAYVNPVVAVALGVIFGGEVLTARMAVAGVVIVAAVALITSERAKKVSTGEGRLSSR